MWTLNTEETEVKIIHASLVILKPILYLRTIQQDFDGRNENWKIWSTKVTMPTPPPPQYTWQVIFLEASMEVLIFIIVQNKYL